MRQFWPDRAGPPPSACWQLFFLQAIVQEVQGEPEAAIESLLTSARLNGSFRATHYNLAMLYRDLALASDGDPTRRAYAQQAVQSLEAYLRHTATPEEITAMLGEEFR
jgi:hypothetical protein